MAVSRSPSDEVVSPTGTSPTICSRPSSTPPPGVGPGPGPHSLHSDFPHHDPHMIRLNHQSFGSAPASVLQEKKALENRWLAHPDGVMFTGQLAVELREAARSAIPLLVSTERYRKNVTSCTSSGEDGFAGGLLEDTWAVLKPGYDEIHPTQIALVDNLTTACVAICHRWAKFAQDAERRFVEQMVQMMASSEIDGHLRPPCRTKTVVFCLDVTFGPCRSALARYCGGAGAEIVELEVLGGTAESWLPRSHDEVMERLETQIARQRERFLKENTQLEVFAFLTHVPCTPWILLPTERIIRLLRQTFDSPRSIFRESCVDCAPCIGAVPHFDVVTDLPSADFVLANLHKWAFCPASVALVFAKTSSLLEGVHSPIPGFRDGEGLHWEMEWTGTKDYSAMLSLREAVKYNVLWRAGVDGDPGRTFHEDEGDAQHHLPLHGRSYQGRGARGAGSTGTRTSLTHPEHCWRECKIAANLLAEGWGTTQWLGQFAEEMWGCVRMVKLPAALDEDQWDSEMDLRSTLRARFGVEANVAWYANGGGYFLRLSFAVYNSVRDVEKLRDAVLELVRERAVAQGS